MTEKKEGVVLGNGYLFSRKGIKTVESDSGGFQKRFWKAVAQCKR